MPTQQDEAQTKADQLWGLLADLPVEQKAAVIDHLCELLAMEESTHQSLQ
jgi:hypothetical protein